ncbi:glycosyl transferase group 1 [Acidimicrobium ferrooxidans DSM 10331]|uniref:Glycosyl transferase group 1 n=1 Tax=Acidimicrobium ferrooxidans (strain DSM 10331 / JCM 15462 / NBRC 103882 / ICP) TaxID=525909 RepID=C7M103_ACIFD|nr:glycosyltransferase [Acidimicrobium ferrooxidans]ACU54661.1 glycosyl transferase group 1 [Acidimicrobium ferrooxidans DSM 10331]
MRVLQFVPALLPHDAVGNIVRGLDERLRGIGVSTGIVVAGDRPPPGATSVRHTQLRPDDIVLYHLASRSPEGARLVARHPNVVVHYHNITPPELLLPWLPTDALELQLARREAARILRAARLTMAVSAYNADDARSLGARDVAVTGTLSRHDQLVAAPSTEVLGWLRADRDRRGSPHDWLFVGRLTPHKRAEDLVAALFAYRHATGTDAALTIVGRPASRRYLAHLRRRVSVLGLTARVRILTHPLAPRALADHFRAASVYVTASRHEGFGLPLLEAMSFGLPIAGLAAAAVTETVQTAGVLVDRADPVELAAAAATAAELGPRLRPAMDERLRAYDSDAAFARIVEGLRSVGLEVRA